MKLVGLGQESTRCLWLDIGEYTPTEIGFGISWFYFFLYVLLKVRKYFAFVHGKFHHIILSTYWEEKQVEKILGRWGRKMRIVLEKVHATPRSQILCDQRLTVHYPKPQEHFKVKNKTSG